MNDLSKKYHQHYNKNSKTVADNVRKRLLQLATLKLIKLLDNMPDDELHRATGIDVEVGIY
jgi:hypothetical protein